MKQKTGFWLFRFPELLRRFCQASGLTLVLLLAMLTKVQADTYSESVRFNLRMEEVSLKQVFQIITEQSEFKFIYSNDVVNDHQMVSVTFKNSSVEEILDKVLPEFNLEYKVIDRQVIVFPKEKKETKAKGSSSSTQQQKVITGKVIDEEGIPLPGVSIVIKGSTNGTVSDINGKYTLTNVPADAKALEFSFVGMQTLEIVIANQSVIDVTMVAESIDLDEVISIGYASQKKANIVGAVTAVRGSEIAAIPAADITNAISGRLPGSVIIQQSGEPGNNSAKILVRGRSTLGGNTGPLIVVDGIPGRSLSDVDPVDVASISVLKDASAAIYGATAANGVILVTTKKGKSGLPRLSYQFYQGWMTPTVLPKTTNAGDYSTMLSEYQDYENRNRTYTDEDIALFYSGRDPWEHPNTDWMSDLVAKWTTTSKHNFTIDGGHKGLYYYVSFGYKNEEAIYKAESTNYKQYNVRAKLDIPITKWLKASIDYAGFVKNKLYPTKSAGAVYGQATRLVPTQWSYWPNGKPGPDIEYGDNPVVTSTLETGTDDTKNYINQTTFRFDLTPLEGLSVNGYFTFDMNNQYRKRFQKPWILYFPRWDTAIRDSEGFITDMELTPTPRGVPTPELTEVYDRSSRKLWNVSATYEKRFGDHEFKVFGAYEQISEDWNYFSAFRKYYISEAVKTIDAGSDTDKDNSGTMSIYARKSWIGRINYNYKGKYLVEFLIRRDGSLKFPPNSRWGTFPGILLGWRASEEDFWKNNIGFINYFKLRASYGKMGMDPGAAFQYMNKYVLASGMTFSTDKIVETIVQQQGVANPNITWEKQTTYNIGFDSKFLKNTFHLNTEFFYNKRSDILTPRNASVPGYTGLQLPDENIAEVDNRGFEFDAGYHFKSNSGFSFDLSANLSWSRNKVVFMDEPERAVDWQQRTGHPYGAQLLYNAIGIFADQASLDAYPHWAGAKPGDVIFEDYNNDGQINSDDKILFDKTDAPETFYGIVFDARYKNFSLSILAQGQGEYYRMNIQDSRRGEAGNYFQWSFDNRWTPENIHTDVARAYNRDDQYWAFGRNNSTYHWDNMAYCRLKNLVLGYDFPKSLFGNSGISNLNVFFSGNNLFLIYSAQKNFDPEIGRPMTYPAVKTYALGLKLTF